MLDRVDKNKDGKLTKDEVPEIIWTRLSKADTNQDGNVSKEELEAHFKQRHRGPGGPRDKSSESSRTSDKPADKESEKPAEKAAEPAKNQPDAKADEKPADAKADESSAAIQSGPRFTWRQLQDLAGQFTAQVGHYNWSLE